MTAFFFFLILHGPACNATTSQILFAFFSPLLFKVDGFPSSREFGPADLPAARTLDTLECSWDRSMHQNFSILWLLSFSLLLLTCIVFLLLSALPAQRTHEHKQLPVIFFIIYLFSQVHAQIPSGSLFPPKLEELFLERKWEGKKSLTAEFCSVLRATTPQESLASQ